MSLSSLKLEKIPHPKTKEQSKKESGEMLRECK